MALYKSHVLLLLLDKTKKPYIYVLASLMLLYHAIYTLNVQSNTGFP